MKKKILLLLVFLPLMAFSQDNRLFWDGRDWKRVAQTVDHDIELETRMKRAYLHGVLDGRLYGYLKTWAENATLANDVFGETVDYLSTRELIKSLDHFYNDPLNSYIPVPSAIVIANLYAERVPMDIIDNYIKESREWVTSLVIDLDTLNYSRLIEEKYLRHRAKQP